MTKFHCAGEGTFNYQVLLILKSSRVYFISTNLRKKKSHQLHHSPSLSVMPGSYGAVGVLSTRKIFFELAHDEVSSGPGEDIANNSFPRILLSLGPF